MDGKMTWENDIDELKFFQAIKSNWYQARKLLIHIKIDKAYLSCDPKSNRLKPIPFGLCLKTCSIYVFGHNFFSSFLSCLSFCLFIEGTHIWYLLANMVHHVVVIQQQQKTHSPIISFSIKVTIRLCHYRLSVHRWTIFCSLNIEISFPLSIILSLPHTYTYIYIDNSVETCKSHLFHQ